MGESLFGSPRHIHAQTLGGETSRRSIRRLSSSFANRRAGKGVEPPKDAFPRGRLGRFTILSQSAKASSRHQPGKPFLGLRCLPDRYVRR